MPTRFYIALGIGVNFVWGLAFAIPYFLQRVTPPDALKGMPVTPVHITLGRYLVYGAVAAMLLLLARAAWRDLEGRHWRTAFVFAFAGNVGYYLCLTLAIRYAGISLSALIVGTLPVTMMLYGNLVNREFAFRRLLLPGVMILAGIVLLNLGKLHGATARDALTLAGGGLFAVVALALWTWYGVSNARYLKRHPEISSELWSLAIGLCCLVQALIGLPALMLLGFGSPGANGWGWPGLIAASLILGVVVSWLATIWWNRVSRHLPVTLAGQLIVFEAIASLMYGYLIDARLPAVLELLCAAIILGGVVLGIRATTQTEALGDLSEGTCRSQL